MYGKSYKVGFGFGYNYNDYVTKDNGMHDKTTLHMSQFKIELLQRVMIRRWSINWDLGAYGGVNFVRNVTTKDNILWNDENGNPLDPQPYDKEVETQYKKCKSANRFEFGATTRISYCFMNQINLGVYANYRFTDVLKLDDPVMGPKTNQPMPWCIGVEIEIVH